MKAPLLLSLLFPLSLLAQNPLVNTDFTADPTARVFNGRIYVYPSHDIPPVPIPTQRPDWFCMGDYHCYSSTNLTDWTDHGVILDQKDVPWGDPQGYSMWAPDCVLGRDGRYYFFFPDAIRPEEGKRGGFGIGVAVSDTPEGPFQCVGSNFAGVMGIDPCVLQASNGHNYMFWGGGGLRVAELSDDLLSLSESELQQGQDTPFGKVYGHNIEGLPEGFKEGPFAFERKGKYYLTYPWVRGKQGDLDANGRVIDNPTEALAYAMSDSPMGPFEYKGIIMEESPTQCWTNHHSIVQYQGQWYLFYHHNDYSPRFDKNRAMCCDSLFFNADGTIRPVRPTKRGVGITDAQGKVQMDRYSEIGGGASIAYLDTNDYRQGWKVILPPGGWVTYGNVRMPQGDYRTWVRTLGWRGHGQIVEVEETTLQLQVIRQKNKLSTLRLSNQGQAPVEVDWVSLSAHHPIALDPQEGPASQLSTYFRPAQGPSAQPDEEGFIRRWLLLDPITKPNPTNTVFTDSYLREAFAQPYFAAQSLLTTPQTPKALAKGYPQDQSVALSGGHRHVWHAMDSQLYNNKLFRLATCQHLRHYGVLFWATTIIECDEELTDVRLAAGSNGASMWWLNGQEALLLSGDRRMVRDDGTSARLTLHRGRNVLTCAVINGPGMSDFCARFIDANGHPVQNVKITLNYK